MRYLWVALAVCLGAPSSLAATLGVPSPYPDFASAYAAAQHGDTIEFAPGTHTIPPGFTVGKRLTLGSWFETRNDPDALATTKLAPPRSGDDGLTFEFGAFGSRIVGLTFGDFYKPISSYTHQDILWNHFLESHSDQIDLEAGAGGTIAHNVFDNSDDDAIDLDGDTETLIEFNTIRNPDDDGIEIRLHESPPRSTVNEIRHNLITGAGEDGIQLIDYDDVTPREYRIHHNIIANSRDAGIGCMDDGVTSEDLGGCAMPELVLIYNNTIVGNSVGITGGDNMFVVNNIVAGNAVGIRRVDGESVVAYTLLSNQVDFESTNRGPGVLETPPGFEGTDYALSPSSPAVDAGVVRYSSGGRKLFELDPSSYHGVAPDLGARELEGGNDPASEVSISAGPDLVITGDGTTTLLAAVGGEGVQVLWSVEDGPGAVVIEDESAVRTRVSFSTQGRYTLRVEAWNGAARAVDTIVVTFAAEERDRSFTIAAPATLLIEAEDYGVRVGKDLSPEARFDAHGGALMVAQQVEGPAFLEYEIIATSEGFDYDVWVRMVAVAGDPAQLAVSLDNGAEQVLTTTSNGFAWRHLAQPFTAPAGVYPLRLRAISSGTAWDAIYVTTDPSFHPQEVVPPAPPVLLE